VIVFKTIKPSRLKVDAMRLKLLNAMRSCGTEIKQDFEKTTATWEHKPEFEVLVSLTGPGPVVLVGTDDKVYRYVSEGTRPHLIFAGYYTGKTNKRALVFKSGYRAKTTPRVLGSSEGGAFGTTVVRPYVEHPGTEAREFDSLVQELWETKFKRRMEQAMKEVAQASGHRMR